MPPTARDMELAFRDTPVTDAFLTVTVHDAEADPAAAVIFAVPADTPVTFPLESTDATEPSDVDHATVSAEGETVALSWYEPPASTVMLDWLRDTETLPLPPPFPCMPIATAAAAIAITPAIARIAIVLLFISIPSLSGDLCPRFQRDLLRPQYTPLESV